MGLDHSNAFVRLTFDGLIALCINKRAEPQICEIGMVAAEHHLRRLTVTQLKPNGVEEIIHGPYDLKNNNEVIIETENPETPGVSCFHSDTFDRLKDTGDPEDFRWVMDLQGPDFHDENISLNKGGSGGVCRPKIVIHHGIFYTHSKTPHGYFRYPRPGCKINTGCKEIGKIADKIGADIIANPITGKVIIQIANLLEKPIELEPEGLLKRYRIDITNLCGPDGAPVSDFPNYYSVASDKDGIEFDIYPMVPVGTERFTKSLDEFLVANSAFASELPEHFAKFRANGPPEVCSGGSFSKTNTIPD